LLQNELGSDVERFTAHVQVCFPTNGVDASKNVLAESCREGKPRGPLMERRWE